MGGLFSSNAPAAKKPAAPVDNKNRVTEHDKAILKLKNQRDQLNKYQKQAEVVLEREKEVARDLLKAGNKQRALIVMKKRKYQEKLLADSYAQLETLEHMTQSLEFQAVELKVIEGIKAGNEAFKVMEKVLNVDDVARLMDEARDGIEYAKEIDALVSGGLSIEDTDAVNADFEALFATELQQEAELAAQKAQEAEAQAQAQAQREEEEAAAAAAAAELPELPDVPVGTEVDLPSVPSHPVGDEDILAQLEEEHRGEAIAS